MNDSISLEAQLELSRQQNASLLKACKRALRSMESVDEPDFIPVENDLRRAIKLATVQKNPRFTDLMSAYSLALASLPSSTHPRLARALNLAVAGHVSISDGEARVKSSSGYGVYTINGQPCDCPDDGAPLVNGVKACKHQLAVWLVLKARTLGQKEQAA